MNLSSVSLMLQDKYNFQYRLDMHVPVLAVRCRGKPQRSYHNLYTIDVSKFAN